MNLFVSLMLVEAGAEGWRPQPSSDNSLDWQQQGRRKSIASVRSVDTADGSRVSITSDVPLNDYEAYWGGDRFFVIIPNAEITYQNVQTLQASLRGQGFQDIRIERKGNDLVFSFRMRPGFRARPEQKFNRLDIILTAPPGVILTPNVNRNTGPVVRPGNTNTGTGTTIGTQLGGNTNTGGGTSGTGGTLGNRGAGGGTSAGASSGGGTRRGGGGGARTRGGRSGGYSGYTGGGSDRGGGGAPLNIPLPSDIQQPTPTPGATTPGETTGASPGASPAASPTTGAETAQTTGSPTASTSPTPEQIAQANQPPVAPVTAPPATSSTDTNAPAATNTGFAAAVRENWLPLLIGLLVLAAIGLLLASRSRADGREGRETAAGPLQTKKQETIKEKPASRTGAAVAGGTAGAAAVAAMAKESRAKTTTAAEEAKAIEPVTPAVGMEKIGSEVKSLLDGNAYDESVIGSTNPETRQIVATELMAALASRNPDRQQRARQAFTRHGFFDEATRKLRTANDAAERISAARALGLTQDHAATQHLVVALEDEDPEVRRAAVNALAELRDPAAIGPLNALLEREKNRKVPHSLIRRAIEASATIDLPRAEASPQSAAAQETPGAGAQKKDKDDDDREVFEI